MEVSTTPNDFIDFTILDKSGKVIGKKTIHITVSSGVIEIPIDGQAFEIQLDPLVKFIDKNLENNIYKFQ